MKKSLADLAIFGGKLLFAKVLPAGQLNVPDWGKIEGMCDAVFDRHYFTNHGVLAKELEEKLCVYLNVNNAITLTNESISLMYVATALGLKRGAKVVVPAIAPPFVVQSLVWMGIEPVFCDIDKRSFLLTPDRVRPLLEEQKISAILASDLWGALCDKAGFSKITKEFDTPVFYDATHAFGCGASNVKSTEKNCYAEVFSLHTSNVLSAGEGGFVATDDDEIAEKLRNLRSSYGRRKDVSIPVDGNGRFSELQAGFALLSLDDLEKNIQANKNRKLRYIKKLQSIEGIDILLDDVEIAENAQCVVIVVNELNYGLSRDMLVNILKAENIQLDMGFTKTLPDIPIYKKFSVTPIPVAESLASSVMLLPNGDHVSPEYVELICSVIKFAHENSNKISNKLDIN